MDSTSTLFLTGATGQLGSFLLAELLGHGTLHRSSVTILCAKRPSSTFEQLHITAEFLGLPADALTSDPHVHFLDMDLGDALHCRDLLQEYCQNHHLSTPTSIIHAAASINISPSAKKAKLSNAALTNEMLLLSELIGAEHFTHISSIAVMGGSAPLGEELLLEAEDFQPNRTKTSISDYALSKMNSELAVWRAASEGQSISIIRPGVILGVGPKHAAPQELWKRIYTGGIPISTDGMTGVVDVRDVAEIAVTAHQQKSEGPNVAVAQNLEFDELLKSMAAALGKKPSFRFLPREPWLERMRSVGFLAKLPYLGRFFSPQMRIMLYSRVRYNGNTGEELLKGRYRSAESTIEECGGYLVKHF